MTNVDESLTDLRREVRALELRRQHCFARGGTHNHDSVDLDVAAARAELEHARFRNERKSEETFEVRLEVALS